jgi:hypothetical protein
VKDLPHTWQTICRFGRMADNAAPGDGMVVME